MIEDDGSQEQDPDHCHPLLSPNGIPHTLSGNLIGLYFMDFYLPF